MALVRTEQNTYTIPQFNIILNLTAFTLSTQDNMVFDLQEGFCMLCSQSFVSSTTSTVLDSTIALDRKPPPSGHLRKIEPWNVELMQKFPLDVEGERSRSKDNNILGW